MEGKKPSSSSIADALFGRKKEEEELGSSSNLSSSPGYFSSVFPPASSSSSSSSSKVTRRDTLQRYEGLTANAQTLNAVVEEKAKEGHAKCPAQSKERKPICPDDQMESPYFGSSVHYGGRDFYTGSPAKNSSEATNSHGDSQEDGQDNSGFATRGDWWQGSLYY